MDKQPKLLTMLVVRLTSYACLPKVVNLALSGAGKQAELVNLGPINFYNILFEGNYLFNLNL